MSSRTRRAAIAVLMTTVAGMTTSCGGRAFPSEEAAVRQFRSHRSAYEQLVKSFLDSNKLVLAVPGESTPRGDSDFARLGRSLAVLDLAVVPQRYAQEDQQWVEIRLAQEWLRSTYGYLYVPEGHQRAFRTVSWLVVSPGHGIRVVRPIEGRWFYFDYD